MGSRTHRGFWVLAALLSLFLAVEQPAHAQSLDTLRASGAVGESLDGYLIARDPSAQSFVNEVNAKRQQIYAQRAAAQGVPASEVGKVYAKELLQKAPPGTWYQSPSGGWVQK